MVCACQDIRVCTLRLTTLYSLGKGEVLSFLKGLKALGTIRKFRRALAMTPRVLEEARDSQAQAKAGDQEVATVEVVDMAVSAEVVLFNEVGERCLNDLTTCMSMINEV